MASSNENEIVYSRNHRCKALLKETDLKPNDHPLHLIISRKSASSLGISADDNQIYLSLWTNTKVSQEIMTHPPGKSQGCIFQRMLSNSQNFPEILVPESDEGNVDVEDMTTGLDIEVFVTVRVRNEDVEESSEYDITLTCSQQFLTHYNIENTTVFVRPVKLYPVSNVVLGVSSHETFQWLTNKKFCSRLLLEIQSNSVLIRTKDVFLSSYGNFLEDPDFKRNFYFDIFVLECSPVQQGLITSKTEFVLTYLGDLAAEQEHFKSKMESLVSNPRQGDRMITGPFKDILMSDFSFAVNPNYLSPEIDLDEPDSMPSFKKKANAIQNWKKKSRSEIVGHFEYEVVPQQPLFRRMLWREEKVQNFDPLYFVGMSRKQMIKEGLFDSSYVLISPEYYNDDCDDDKTYSRIERLCMVRCLGKEYDKSRRLFISPLCLFNMQNKPPIELPISLIMKV
ncbi:uncharacterized protein LOC132758309 [Ruditapes philippinarum]|uniref:uncharacterized protein LOC132758309 n=1 Tax=Ruditapes philippinarum TaxID=129788 RepID=UPI00295A7ED6|nr:uncharacterized protein LOC132758309 [Ruditapes philippinarum]